MKCNRKRTVIRCLICLAWIYPLIRFKYFYYDWYNHIYLIEYYGEFLKTHNQLPSVINTINHTTGFALPMYYGRYLYDSIGFLCAYVGGKASIGIAIIFVTYAQVVIWGRALHRFGDKSLILATCFVLSVYSSTNLYIRGAITEFFAVAILDLAIGLWLIAVDSTSISKRLFFSLCTGILLSLLPYIHPITFMLGTFYFVLVFVFTYRRFFEKMKAKHIVVLMVIVLLCTMHALQFIYLEMTIPTLVSNVNTSYPLYYDGIDDLLSRLSCFPFDKRVYVDGINTSTPNLCASINIILYWIGLTYVARIVRHPSICIKNKKTIVIWYAIMAFVVAVSVFYILGNLPLIHYVLRMIQFPYRLVSYIDLGAVCGIWLISTRSNVDEIAVLGKQELIIYGLLCQLLIVRFYQIDAIAESVYIDSLAYETEDIGTGNIHIKPYDGEKDNMYTLNDIEELPLTYYGEFAYKYLDDYELITNELVASSRVFNLYDDSVMGGVQSIRVSTDEQSEIIGIRMYPHPYNRLYVDGAMIPASEIMYTPDISYRNLPVYIEINKGQHVIDYRFEPNNGYLMLGYVKNASLCVMIICAFTYVGVMTMKEKRG